MSRFYRSKLVTLRTQIKGGISDRNLADQATRAVLKRIAGGVRVDERFGSNSPLYRAMGYIPEHEWKSPAAAPSSQEATAPKAPRPARPSLMARLNTMRSAWALVAPSEEIVGMTLSQFDEAVAPSHTTRQGLEEHKTNLRATIGSRDAADAASLALVRQVVRSVTAATAYGSDCALYRALGFIPDSERRSARRSSTATTQAAPAQ